MQQKILDRIAKKTGITNLVDLLGSQLSGADLNSLLLEVFHQRSARMTPEDLLLAYKNNRFVHPSAVDALDFQAFVLDAWRMAGGAGFEPVQLSPLSPLGACSVVATVHQHKIISALRGTEVTADATNALALESAVRRSKKNFPAETLHCSTTHRHVRAQEIPDIPGFSAHFTLLGLTSAGRDTGSFRFEKESLLRHIRFYVDYFEANFQLPWLKIRLKALDRPDEPNRVFEAVAACLQETEPDWPIEITRSSAAEQGYYQHLQFKIVIPGSDGRETDIADGGFTDWTQKLSGFRKERFLISGLGLEMLFKIEVRGENLAARGT
jgi:hypothetical protein